MSDLKRFYEDVPVWAMAFAQKVMSLVQDAREKGKHPDTCLVHPDLWPKEMGEVRLLELNFGARVVVEPNKHIPEGMCALYESDIEGRRSVMPLPWEP